MGESFSIQISANLIKQLADDIENSKKGKRPKPKKVAEKSSKELQKVDEKPHFNDSPQVSSQGIGPVGWPQQPLFPSPPSPSVTGSVELEAIRATLEQSEKVLQKLQKQEEEMVREVSERAKDLHEKEFKLPNQKPVPCLSEKEACSECYSKNILSPLKCAEAVKNYADCARRVRQQQTANYK